MSKVQNGLILIGVGVLLNILGRIIIPFTRSSPNVITAGFMALWMIASVVLVFFGLSRLIVGLATKNKA